MGSSREGDERLCERAAWEFGTQVTTVWLWMEPHDLTIAL
jgi:hypothetical protein